MKETVASVKFPRVIKQRMRTWVNNIYIYILIYWYALIYFIEGLLSYKEGPWFVYAKLFEGKVVSCWYLAKEVTLYLAVGWVNFFTSSAVNVMRVVFAYVLIPGVTTGVPPHVWGWVFRLNVPWNVTHIFFLVKTMQ